MSAGRITWNATGFDTVEDPVTGTRMDVKRVLPSEWSWTVSGRNGAIVPDGKGTKGSPSAAKGAARKAMERAAKVGGEREERR